MLACPYGAISSIIVVTRPKSATCARIAARPVEVVRPARQPVPAGPYNLENVPLLLHQARNENRTIRNIDHFGLIPSTIYLEHMPRGSTLRSMHRSKQMRSPKRDASGELVRGTYCGTRTTRSSTPNPCRAGSPGPITSAGIFRYGAISYTDAGNPPRADRTVVGACPICFNSCPVTYHLANDRLTAVTAWSRPGHQGALVSERSIPGTDVQLPGQARENLSSVPVAAERAI